MNASRPLRLALFEPDIPQNTGSILRLGACLGVVVDIIEPCGFVLDDRRLRRAGMDYLDLWPQLGSKGGISDRGGYQTGGGISDPPCRN